MSTSTDPTAADPTATVHRLAAVDQIPVGEARTFAVDGEQVAVFRLRDGTVRGLSAVCSHRGGPLADGQFDARVVICPLHLAAFDLDTGCSTTGAAPVRRFDVAVEGADVVLHLP
ncbi:Rieske (2Fe-2S) protein [Isoptericola jiangsuensis]|uniref:Rieske (2Fe-2S) protein n=1 Tax=Isoptericola jiangsuensis TaxID=548579 RepID=UPI003AB099A2